MNKLLFLTIASALIISSQFAQAKVIELDNTSPDKCRQQILDSGDEFPIILAYERDCGPAKKFLPLYESVSNEVQAKDPKRAFFKFDFQDSYTWHIQLMCLQQAGILGSPTVMMVFNLKPISGDSVYSAPLKAGGGGEMTREELLKLIDPSQAKKSIEFPFKKA